MSNVEAKVTSERMHQVQVVGVEFDKFGTLMQKLPTLRMYCILGKEQERKLISQFDKSLIASLGGLDYTTIRVQPKNQNPS